MVVMGNMSFTLFIVLCILIYAGMYGGFSMVFSMMEEGGIPIRVAGTAIGLVCTLGYLPEVIVPFASGKLLVTFGDDGYRYIFIAIVVIMIIGIVMLTVWDRYTKKLRAKKPLKRTTQKHKIVYVQKRQAFAIFRAKSLLFVICGPPAA